MFRPRQFLPLALVLFLALQASAQSWTLAWSDEFTGDAGGAPNSNNWTYDLGNLNVNDEVEFYCAPWNTNPPCSSSTPNAYLDGNGHLIIQALRITPGTNPYSGSWTSARLKTEGLININYGRVESSMSLPLGPGLWPAFWALGTNLNSAGWPASGEMDFMENVPASAGLGPSTISSTLHGGITSSDCYCGGNGLGKRYTFPSNDPNGTDVTSFHTYGAIWSANMVEFYVDDPTNIFFVRTASDVPSGFTWDFNHPFFVILNLAVGGTGSWPGPPNSTTPSPAIMTVDYVRWYTASAIAGPTMTATPITVTAGQSGISTVSLGSAQGTGRVYLTCSTNAPAATCTVSTSDPLDQYTVDFSQSANGSATVKVTTTANSSAELGPNRMAWSGLVLAGILVVPFGRNRSARSTLGMFLLLALLASCGQGNSSTPPLNNGTPPGSYTITVSAYTVSNTTGTADSTGSTSMTVN
jgi:beta-glucanase (GH16 family)